jgi:hypothetical protein
LELPLFSGWRGGRRWWPSSKGWVVDIVWSDKSGLLHTIQKIVQVVYSGKIVWNWIFQSIRARQQNSILDCLLYLYHDIRGLWDRIFLFLVLHCTAVVIVSSYLYEIQDLFFLYIVVYVRNVQLIYRGKSIIIRNTVVFMFLLATLSFCATLLCMVSVLLFLCRLDGARSVPLSLPCC